LSPGDQEVVEPSLLSTFLQGKGNGRFLHPLDDGQPKLILQSNVPDIDGLYGISLGNLRFWRGFVLRFPPAGTQQQAATGQCQKHCSKSHVVHFYLILQDQWSLSQVIVQVLS